MNVKRSSARTFRVSEYLSASAIMASGVQFQGSVLGDDNRVAFLFSNEQGEAESALLKHVNGTLRISSREMATAVTTLKDTIFSLRRRMVDVEREHE